MVQSNVVESNASPTSDDASTSSTGRKKLRFLFVETLKHSLSNSAVNALPSIGREKNWYVKIFWLILFFAGMVLSTNFSYTPLMTYFSNQIVPSIDLIGEPTSVFPAVTICNLNAFDVGKPGVQSEMLRILRGTPTSEFKVNATNRKSVYEQFRRVLNMLKARVVESNSSNILGYDIETMLISCYFDDRKCDTSDFVKFQMFEYINCFTYNTRADIKRTARTRKGLSLELFAGNASELSIELGFYVIVHNNSVIPLKKRGFKVPTGRGADIGVQRIVESNLVDCRPSVTVASSSDSAYYKVAASQPSTVYFQQLCFQVCLQDAIEIKCNCSEPSLALYTKRNVCATLDALDCASDERNRFLASPEWLTTCTQACPRECNSVDFTPNLHYSNYPSLNYYNQMAKRLDFVKRFRNLTTFNLFRRSVAQINVFYEDMTSTEYTESPALTLGTLSAIIGNWYGLFVGMTVLTIFEVVEFFIELIYRYYKFNHN